jgi:hypothetical protein
MPEALSVERKKSKGDQPGKTVAPVSDTSKSDTSKSDTPSRVAELQVSAHLMTLETGLFCVFQSPGSPPPDPVSGLPGVRITPAPGPSGRSDAVSVSTFRSDGWLAGTAALVRVTDGSAQILVTIYQQKGHDAAPRLQVLRLSGASAELGSPVATAGPAAPVAKPPAPAAATPEVMAHVQRMGDVGCMLGEWLGSKGSRQWVEGFGMAPASGVAAEDVEYQAVLGRDWLSPWVESGKFCGSRGMALPLLGIRVRLKGAAAKEYECNYSATFIDGSAVGPVSGGEACEAESLAALEAFQIVMQPRSIAVAPAKASVKASGKPVPAKRSMKPSRARPVRIAKPVAKPRAKLKA